MSAFVISDETMHRVVEAFVLYEKLPSVPASELGDMLFEMNFAAMRARYGDTFEPSDYRHAKREATPAEMFKAVECLLYQCSEGSVPNTTLYAMAEEVAERLAVKLTGLSDVTAAKQRAWHLPEVERAPWDYH